MEFRHFPNSKLQISRLGLGGIPLQRVTASEVGLILATAREAGINFIDTARGYSVSEELLGQGLKSKRTDFVLASKSMQRSKEGILQDIKLSLTSLGTDYLDIYQLHNIRTQGDWEQVSAPDGALAGLIEAQQAGLILQLGVTSHSADTMAIILEQGQFASMMFPYNVIESQNKQLFATSQIKGTLTLAMKPLAGGFIPKASQAIRYLATDTNVDCILVGMGSHTEITANTKALEEGPLTLEETRELEAWAAQAGQDFCRRCGYCLPCPQGIDIPMVFLLEGYYDRYELQGWSQERYATLPVPGTACQACGQCEEKCPYGLPIAAKMARAAEKLSS
ncbi:MAG: aldo/keto reductase [Carboxydocellales bacterium]